MLSQALRNANINPMTSSPVKSMTGIQNVRDIVTFLRN